MKVGVFDSGLGGLTVLKSMVKYCPQLNYVYLGDSQRAPYGNRTFNEVLQFTTQAMEYLFNKKNCKIIIIACNTASAKALRHLQQNYLTQKQSNKKILGVVRPATEYLSQKKEIKNLALWGTQGTIDSKSYEIELKDTSINITTQACIHLAKFIEENNQKKIKNSIQNYWKETLNKNPDIDTLFLACTHYPLILSEIKSIIGKNITLLDQTEIVGKKWLKYLKQHPEISNSLSTHKHYEYLTTHNQVFQPFHTIMGKEIKVEKIKL